MLYLTVLGAGGAAGAGAGQGARRLRVRAGGAAEAGATARRSGVSALAAARTRLQVKQVEYRLLLSAGVVHAGSVSLQELDAGTQEHDLRAQRIGSSGQIAGRRLRPGGRWEGTVDLVPGVYRLWCSLPEHARLGMRTTLRVIP